MFVSEGQLVRSVPPARTAFYWRPRQLVTNSGILNHEDARARWFLDGLVVYTNIYPHLVMVSGIPGCNDSQGQKNVHGM